MSREKKFTPGPWGVLSSENEDLFIEKHKILTVTSVKTSDANFQIEVMDASDDTQKAEANANLIAAAPELLEALEEMSALLGGIIKDVLNDNFRSVKLLAGAAKTEIVNGNTMLKVAAIKKAYGETK